MLSFGSGFLQNHAFVIYLHCCIYQLIAPFYCRVIYGLPQLILSWKDIGFVQYWAVMNKIAIKFDVQVKHNVQICSILVWTYIFILLIRIAWSYTKYTLSLYVYKTVGFQNNDTILHSHQHMSSICHAF